MKRKIVYIILAIGLLAAAYGYYQYQRPVASLDGEKAALKVEAAALLADYESDETSANTKYFDKIIAVSGTISKIAESEGKPSVYLNTGSDLSFVICELENAKAGSDLKVGDSIVMKGKCTGYLSDVILVQALPEN